MEDAVTSAGGDASEVLIREGLFGGKSFNSVWDAPDTENGPDEKERVRISNLIESAHTTDITDKAVLASKLYTESSDQVMHYLRTMGLWDHTQKVAMLTNKISPLRFFNYVRNNREQVLDMHILNGLSFNETYEGRCVVRMAEGVYYVHLVNDEGYRHTRNVFIGEWSGEKILAFYTDFIGRLLQHDSLEAMQPVCPEAMEGVILDPLLLDGIMDDVKNFVMSRDIYERELKIPWKRGYMLIGEAGVGKTLTIRNLIKYWGFEYRDISKMLKRGGDIDFSELSPSGNKNYIDQRAYPTRTKPSVCVIEDIDKFVVGQSSGSNREGDAGAVSLHMLLKALDGIDTIGGVILMATTNHPDQMTEALLARPGRFDRIIKMVPPSNENIERFLISRKLSVTDAPLSAVSEAMAGYSMAFVEELVKSAKMIYRRSEFTFEELSGILNRIHEHKKTSDKYLGRKQGSMGFSM